MPLRNIRRNRRGVVTTAVAVIAVGSAVTGGIVSKSWSSPDTSGPSLFISSPSASSLAQAQVGTVTLTATCGDNVGCVGVQFKLNGANLGTEDTTSGDGWTASFDTTLVSDGSYTISAVARDAAGNTNTSNTKTITTANGDTGSGTEVAKLWVAPNGSSSCTKNPTAVTYTAAVSSGNVCDKGTTAYNKAALGDTVIVKGGTYTSQWLFTAANTKTVTNGTCNYNYPGTADLHNCIVEKAAIGETVNFNVAGTSTPAIKVCVNGLELQRFTVTPTTYSTVTNGVTITVTNDGVALGKSDSSCLPGGSPPHDNYIREFDTPQNTMVGGVSNTWFVSGTSHGAIGNPWQMGSQGNNSGTIPAHDNGIVGVVFYGFVQAPPQHFECVHMDFSGTHNTVADSTFENCPVYAIRVEAEGGTTNGGNAQTNHVIENNFFDSGAASGLVNVDCHDDGCVMTGNTIRFNSFSSGTFTPTNDCAQNIGGVHTCTVNTNVFYGNTGATCPSSATIIGLGWTPSYNVWSGSQSGICTGDATSVYSVSSTFSSPGGPGYDLHLSGAVQSADNLVPTSVTGGCPATDFDGAVRPAETNCDAGADERTTGSIVTGASLATCSPSACADPGYSPAGASGCVTSAANHIKSVGNINNGSISECRIYGYYVPTNLTGAAPAIIIAGGAGCGTSEIGTAFDNSDIGPAAVAAKAIVIVLAKPTNPGCRSAWYHPNIDVPAPAAGSPSEEPYLTAVVADIKTSTFSGATVDPNRIFLSGSSSGGALAWDAACDTTNSTAFHGIAPNANLMNTTKSGSAGVPNTERCASTNKNFLLYYSHGTSDPQVPYAGVCVSDHCLPGFDELRAWTASHMGCSSTATTTSFGTPSASNTKYTYGSCTFGSPANSVIFDSITSGGHGWDNITSTAYKVGSGGGACTTCNDFYYAREMLAAFAAYSWVQ